MISDNKAASTDFWSWILSDLISFLAGCSFNKSAADFLADLGTFSLEKYSTLNLATSTPETSTLVEVAITYLALTLLNGTPLTLNGPETNKVLSSKFFK